MGHLQIKCLLSGDQTGSKIAVFEERVAPLQGPPLHAHDEQHEIFHVIAGRILFHIEGEVREVAEGGAIMIPPGKAHCFYNPSAEDEALIHFELLPAGTSEEFFRRLCAGDFADPAQLFSEHGLKLLGPPINQSPRTVNPNK